jgi:hypothetical protein
MSDSATQRLPPRNCAMRMVHKALMTTVNNMVVYQPFAQCPELEDNNNRKGIICITLGGERTETDIEVEELEDNNDGFCFMCNTAGGELVYCDNCSNACHKVCLGQTIDSPPDVWHCPPCSTKGGVPCAAPLVNKIKPDIEVDIIFQSRGHSWEFSSTKLRRTSGIQWLHQLVEERRYEFWSFTGKFLNYRKHEIVSNIIKTLKKNRNFFYRSEEL